MACKISASGSPRVAGAVLFGLLLWAADGSAQESQPSPQALQLWPTPPQLAGRCSTVWTSSVGKYELPYRVDFGDAGSFRWWAPMHLGGVELGTGVFLSAPRTIVRDDGSWEVGYFAANRFTPDPANSTNCCCEYVGQAGPGQPRILADYFMAVVPNTAHLPMQEVCAPYVRQCPGDNATALQTVGKPFIEIYSPCAPLAGVAWAGWPSTKVAALVTLCVVLQLALVIRGRLSKHAEEEPEEIEEGYHSLGASSWLEDIFEAKAVREQRQLTGSTEYSETTARSVSSDSV